MLTWHSRFVALGVLAAAAGVVAGAPWAQAAVAGTGTVTGIVDSVSTGAPLSGICVNVVNASTNNTVGTSLATGKKGAWTLAHGPSGTTYTATAFVCKGKKDYVSQWYDQQNFQSTATQFSVTTGAKTRGIDFSLSQGGAVSGKVTNSAKQPVQGILVIPFWTTNFSASSFATCTSSTGAYKITGVPTSGVKLEFYPNACGISSSYATVWYKNESSYDSSAVVPITAGATTVHINQRMETSPS